MSPNLELIGFELTEFDGYKVAGHMVGIGAMVAISTWRVIGKI